MTEVNTGSSMSMTESAAKRVLALALEAGEPTLMLRIKVTGGGCAGFHYHFSLETESTTFDRVFKDHGAHLVVDNISLDLLDGSSVDYVEDLMGAFFRVDNPNAQTTCGCGSSFSTKFS